MAFGLVQRTQKELVRAGFFGSCSRRHTTQVTSMRLGGDIGGLTSISGAADRSRRRDRGGLAAPLATLRERWRAGRAWRTTPRLGAGGRVESKSRFRRLVSVGGRAHPRARRDRTQPADAAGTKESRMSTRIAVRSTADLPGLNLEVSGPEGLRSVIRRDGWIANRTHASVLPAWGRGRDGPIRCRVSE